MTKIEALELELAARKMVKETNLGWVEVLRSSKCSPVCRALEAYFLCDIELALGIIEGKPVWEGDSLYTKEGVCFVVMADTIFVSSEVSWNPPKPKTVMVELTVEDFCLVESQQQTIALLKKQLTIAEQNYQCWLATAKNLQIGYNELDVKHRKLVAQLKEKKN